MVVGKWGLATSVKAPGTTGLIVTRGACPLFPTERSDAHSMARLWAKQPYNTPSVWQPPHGDFCQLILPLGRLAC